MSAAFTPGPWEVEEDTTLIWARDGGVNGTPVARCETQFRQWGRNVPMEEHEANANLIAAAPDLYEALNGAPLPSTLGNVESHYERFYEWYNNVACPALAKARGEQSDRSELLYQVQR
jgi:hypothetical protein